MLTISILRKTSIFNFSTRKFPFHSLPRFCFCFCLYFFAFAFALASLRKVLHPTLFFAFTLHVRRNKWVSSVCYARYALAFPVQVYQKTKN